MYRCRATGKVRGSRCWPSRAASEARRWRRQEGGSHEVYIVHECPCAHRARVYIHTINPPAAIAPNAARRPNDAPPNPSRKVGSPAETPPLTFMPLALSAAEAALPACEMLPRYEDASITTPVDGAPGVGVAA